jgi:hypothetical protein
VALALSNPSPAANATVGGGETQIPFSVTVSGGATPLAYVTFQVWTAGYGSLLIDEYVVGGANGLAQAVLDFSALPSSVYAVLIEVKDADEVQESLYYDLSYVAPPPVALSNLSPAAGETFDASEEGTTQITFSTTLIGGALPIQYVTFQVWTLGFGQALESGTAADYGGGVWRATLDFADLPTGQYSVLAQVRDADFEEDSDAYTLTYVAPPIEDTLSLAARRLYEQVKQLETDTETYPLAHVCAMLAAPIDPLYDILTAGDVPWSVAFDPEEAAELLGEDRALEVVRWLGQFAGLTLSESQSLLEQRLTLTESQAAKRGTRGAIEAAVRASGLIGPDGTPQTATVYITERVGGSPYGLAVATLDSETPDPDAVERALDPEQGGAIPAGRDWTYTTLTGGTYADLAATHADYAEVQTDFATYADVRADPTVT